MYSAAQRAIDERLQCLCSVLRGRASNLLKVIHQAI